MTQACSGAPSSAALGRGALVLQGQGPLWYDIHTTGGTSTQPLDPLERPFAPPWSTRAGLGRSGNDCKGHTAVLSPPPPHAPPTARCQTSTAGGADALLSTHIPGGEGNGERAKFAMARFGAEKIWHPFLNTTAKFGTKSHTAARIGRGRWLPIPAGLWLTAVVSWRLLDGSWRPLGTMEIACQERYK